MTDNTKKSIVCDYCCTELIVDSRYPSHFSLELKAVDTGINTTGIQYAVSVKPPIDGEKHFCGMECLSLWAADNHSHKRL